MLHAETIHAQIKLACIRELNTEEDGFPATYALSLDCRTETPFPVLPEEETRPADEIEQAVRRREAHNRAIVLEMIGDIPEAEVKPPSNMLFICKLNPVTTEEVHSSRAHIRLTGNHRIWKLSFQGLER